jgi:hypothetical protein
MINRISVSKDELKNLKATAEGKKSIYSFFPCDKFDCPCQAIITDYKNKLVLMSSEKRHDLINSIGFITCPRNKDGYTKYQITCNNCGEIVGECYAKDETLKDFFDFHYIVYSELVEEKKTVYEQNDEDGKPLEKQKKVIKKETVGYWRGALAINISPIDGHIGIECTCGEDTRDFRANTTLPKPARDLKISQTKEGREFATDDSRFNVKEIS